MGQGIANIYGGLTPHQPLCQVPPMIISLNLPKDPINTVAQMRKSRCGIRQIAWSHASGNWESQELNLQCLTQNSSIHLPHRTITFEIRWNINGKVQLTLRRSPWILLYLEYYSAYHVLNRALVKDTDRRQLYVLFYFALGEIEPRTFELSHREAKHTPVAPATQMRLHTIVEMGVSIFHPRTTMNSFSTVTFVCKVDRNN